MGGFLQTLTFRLAIATAAAGHNRTITDYWNRKKPANFLSPPALTGPPIQLAIGCAPWMRAFSAITNRPTAKP